MRVQTWTFRKTNMSYTSPPAGRQLSRIPFFCLGCSSGHSNPFSSHTFGLTSGFPPGFSNHAKFFNNYLTLNNMDLWFWLKLMSAAHLLYISCFSHILRSKLKEHNALWSFNISSYWRACCAYGYCIIKTILEREYTPQTQYNYWCFAQCRCIWQTHTCLSKEMQTQLLHECTVGESVHVCACFAVGGV